jgi:uncharacterized protein YhdP
MIDSRFWIAARNALLKVAAFWVLVLAAYLALGRQFFPYIDRIQPEIEIWLSGQLGTSVTIGELQGEWVRFNPVLHLSNMTLGEDIHVEKMTLAPGIYESISRGGLSFIRFELIDFQADLIQTVDGWSLRGLNTGNGRVDLSGLMALLQRQQEVTFTNTQLSVAPLELPAFDLILHKGRLAGFGSDNSMVAQASIRANNIDVPIELQVEVNQLTQELNRVYFRHGQIDLSPWLQEVADDIVQAEMAGEYWLNLSGDQWQDLTLRLDASSLTYQGEHDAIELNDATFGAYVERRANGFESWLSVAEYQLNEKPFETTQAKLDYRADRLKVEWDSLPVDLVGVFLALDDPNGFWRSLSPEGFIQQGVMTMSPGDPDSLRLSAGVDGLSFGAHQGVPGLSNLSGNILIRGRQGQLEASSANAQLHLPSLYPEPFASRVSKASLTWNVLPDQGLYASGSGTVSLLPGRLFASQQTETEQIVDVFWSSSVPNASKRAEGREALLEVQLSANDVSRDWAIALADNTNVADSTVDWMVNRIEQAAFPRVHLNYLSTVNAVQERHSQFFLTSELEDVQVRFLDKWEPVQNVSGLLRLDGQGLSIQGEDGNYPGFQLAGYQLNLPFATNALSVDVAFGADADAAMSFLQSGPLSPPLNGPLESWTASGPVTADMSLNVPLSAPEDFQVSLNARLDGVAVEIGVIDMAFTNVEGVLFFDRDEGLSSEALTLRHGGLEQKLDLTVPLNSTEADLRVNVRGQTAVSYWGERFSDAFLADNPAIVKHDTQIELRNRRTLIRSESRLESLWLDLPYPMTKVSGTAWPLALEVILDERDWITVKADVDAQFKSYFELDQRRVVRRGSVAYGLPLNVRDDSGVYLDLRADRLNATHWWRTIKRIRGLYAQNATFAADRAEFQSMVQAIDIQVSQLDYLAQRWQDAHLTLLRNDDAWLADFDANEGQGQVLIPHDQTTLFADIDWLNLSTPESSVAFANEQDPLQAFRPGDVPPMQVQINKLIWNQRDLGSWRAEVRQQDSAMVVENVTGDMPGAMLTGELRWSYLQDTHQTGFVGRVAVGDIQTVLNTWSYAPVLSSSDGLFDLEIDWQGSPAFFDFKRISGDIDLQLNRGSIRQIDDYEGLKLIGLLNFTRVIQRLALDFSDLLQSGITFDRVEGELIFDRGFARVGEKLIIDGSATKFKFSGDADLLADEVDIDMVFTVPLSSTFPLVALLAGVSPQAAAAIYVTERVFNNELERLSSARMHITGSFNAPVTRFYRVFDNNLGEQGPSVTDRVNQVVPEGVTGE